MPVPDPLSSSRADSASRESLQVALQQQQQHEKRLNRLTLVAAVLVALMMSTIAANQNLYSLLATFGASWVFLVLASIYQRSLLLLLPLVLVFCLVDNLLSHKLQFDQAHFVLQLLALASFTVLFQWSRPYLLRLMQQP